MTSVLDRRGRRLGAWCFDAVGTSNAEIDGKVSAIFGKDGGGRVGTVDMVAWVWVTRPGQGLGEPSPGLATGVFVIANAETRWNTEAA